MLRNGHYDVTFATVHATGRANVRIEDGLLTGETDRGAQLDGLCAVDSARNVIRYEIASVVPANTTAVTGFSTGDVARRIVFRGETPLCVDNARFSIDFAGRAVDVVARYIRPL